MPALFSKSMLNNIIDRIRLPFRKEKELFSALYGIIGFYPKDISYYKLALMHKSIMRREKGKPLNNERLEFLGDAILDAVIGDIVYNHFTGKREGFLTNTRSKIVQRESLNKLAEETGLTKLIVSSGHTSSHNSYMGGNAFEALVGAIYLDRGYEACKRFMQRRILTQLINIDKVAYKEVNFKSKLIEWSQKNKVTINFKEVKQSNSKKESQQEASQLTLARLRREPQLIERIFASKSQRTKMEEEPISVTELSELSENSELTENMENSELSKNSENSKNTELAEISEPSPKPMSREDIIAAAEAAAFSGSESLSSTDILK